jgi:hypothetical protein
VVCRCCGRGTEPDVGEEERIQDRGLEERMMGGGEAEVYVSGEIARDAADAALKEQRTCESPPDSASSVEMRS